MNTTRIIDYLVTKGILNQPDANQLRVSLLQSGKTEEQLLKDSGVDNTTLVKAKSDIFNVPYVDLRETEIPDNVLTLISADFLKRLNAIPFQVEGNKYKVAMSDPFDVQAIQALEAKLPIGSRLLVFITTQESVEYIIDRKLNEVITSEVSAALEDADSDGVTAIDTEAGEISDENLKNAPVARIVNSILQFAIKSSASDIHIEPQESRIRVRLRIHGILSEKLSLPRSLGAALTSRIKIMSNLKIDEKRIPQDGRFMVSTGGHRVDVRVSTLPAINGEKIVIRLLDSSEGVPSLESTGLRGSAYKTFSDAIKATNGILLVTGPTGSGKTRTLAGTLGKLNDPKVNIITLEDPVEIRVQGVNQVQINSEVGLTFANGLRSILRQDPNVIMVGEIRDHETAQLAVEASLTGHLVLSTLHTNSAASAIPRLLDMGVETYLLASTLRLVAGQRLPRRVCPHCKTSYIAEPHVVQNIQEVLGSIHGFNLFDYLTKVCQIKSAGNNAEADVKCPEKNSDGSIKLYLYKGNGCERCGGSGYMGRVGIFEVLAMTEKISRMIMENRTAQEIEKVAIENGMVKMIQDGYLKALEGITTVEDVLRVSRD